MNQSYINSTSAHPSNDGVSTAIAFIFIIVLLGLSFVCARKL